VEDTPGKRLVRAEGGAATFALASHLAVHRIFLVVNLSGAKVAERIVALGSLKMSMGWDTIICFNIGKTKRGVFAACNSVLAGAK
jgi:hypothetical protein